MAAGTYMVVKVTIILIILFFYGGGEATGYQKIPSTMSRPRVIEEKTKWGGIRAEESLGRSAFHET